MGKPVFFEDFNVGDEMPPLVKGPVSEVQFVRYAGASGDFNPLHTVQAVGEAAGFGGVIAQGMLIMGFVAQAATGWVDNRDLRKLKVRFAGVTRPKDVITVTGRVKEKVEEDNRVVFALEAKDQEGAVKITGSFEAQLSSRG